MTTHEGPLATTDRPRVVVVAPAALGAAIADELGRVLDDDQVVTTSDVTHARAPEVARGPVALLVVSDELGPIDDTLTALDLAPAYAGARIIVVTGRPELADLTRAVDLDRIHAVVAIPWTAGTLGHHVRSQVVRWHHRDASDRPVPGAVVPTIPLGAPSSELLGDLELRPEEVTARLVAAIEQVLGPRPRLLLPRGTRLTHQDRTVDGVAVVLEGHVALDRRTAAGELRLHHDTTGPVVGILALVQQRRAYFTARTTTPVTCIHLSLEQLDRALHERAEVGGALAAAALRALARRLRRSEQLQIERAELNRELDAERQRLADALHQLEQARLELVASARMATLGELAAGIAHELNNPTAVLQRIATYLTDDLDRLLTTHPDAALVRRVLRDAHDRPARSTAEDRASRRELERVLGDGGLARRLVAAGIDDPATARALADGGDEVLRIAEAAAGIGAAVGDLELASRRIGELVAGLREYARPIADAAVEVDLHAGLEDTLRLTAHRLRGIEVERRYGSLPPVRCQPGQLDQVWTNLLVNAAEELGGAGHVEIATDVVDDEHVRVRITDDGPGIDPEVLPRVFEPRFTTKQGRVRYGLGLGLAIARRIVDHHGGTITLESRPGRTVATVVLPIAGPPDDGEVEP